MSPLLSLVLVGDCDDDLLRTIASMALDDAPAELVVSPHGVSDEVRAGAQAALGARLRWVDGQGGLLDRVRAAVGTWIGFLESGDEVEPGVLESVSTHLRERPGIDLLYTDEQWTDLKGEGIRTKPDWVPHYLEGCDYLGRLCLVRRDLVLGSGIEESAAFEWDLHLRCTETTERIEHLPVVGVTRRRPPRTDAAFLASAQQAVAERFARADVRATVEVADPAGYLRVWRAVPDPAPLVSIVIPTGGGRRAGTGDSSAVVETCVRSLVALTTYPSWQVVLVPSEGTPPDVVEAVRSIAGDRLVVAPVTGEFSFSYSVNEGVRVAGDQSDLVVLLNDDTEVIEPRWLDRMVSVAQDPDVGAVGAKLLYSDGTIQHVGIVHDDSWLPVHALRGSDDDTRVFGTKVVDVDWPAVTAACMLVRRDLYVELGGFSTDLPMAFNDVDFCHKVVASGRHVVCTPFATLFHHESATRTGTVRPFELEYVEHTASALAHLDPHVNHRSVR
ncbi:glycosyltransferase family 2 protein [Cellulomonas iranensis]|uniref:glycosyltransferase family 2 protein n=1 Tax=Cellulomonas iranensis TaxID=76862 RepID=UPI003D7D38BC